MADLIHILPSALIDQIAAGEVVERPASVVKELVENSLDAGAARVTCRVEQGGRSLVRVTDDGAGMSRGDALLAVRRHATSKIASADDLARIATLGFRGEALPSIAAVSRLRILTRRAEDPAGTLVLVEAGGAPEASDAASPAGCEVEVRDLFFNTPARRKFLRTQATELGHIQAWMGRLALVCPAVHLRLEHGGRTLLDAPATGDAAQRAAAILGREVFEHLHPVAYREEGIEVGGLACDPEHSRPNARAVQLFVNGRYVRDRMLQHAVMDAYRTVLPAGRYPTVLLKIEMDPALVDVNVHPQKTEVRFGDTRLIHRVVQTAVAEVLAAAPWMRKGRTYRLGSGGGLAEDGSPGSGGRQEHGRARQVREALGRYQRFRQGEGSREPWRSPGFSGARTGSVPGTTTPQRGETAQAPGQTAPAPGALDVPEDFGAGKTELPLSQWRLVGTLWNTYLLLASSGRLVVVDQHAAAERITFERLRAGFVAGRVESQRLLVPAQLEVGGDAEAVCAEHRARLEQVGFEIEPFGPGVVKVAAVPALLSRAQVAPLVRDVLDELAERAEASPWEAACLEVLGRMACHGSVRAGQVLSEQEIRALLAQLERIDYAGTCPHGRPVLVSFPRPGVERWFHRT